MSRPAARSPHRAVSPLELFFDLVFVLALGQLTHHLIEHLSWHGAVETLVMLIAVCGVWTLTSFEVTLLDIERRSTQAITVVVMGLGLFMNAGIAHAFETGPWLFVVPMLLALIGPGVRAALAAPTPRIQQHFSRVLVWFAVSAPLWIAGAALDPETRLWFWEVAAVIDLLATWTAHRTPDRTTRTESHPFDAEHMLERMRLFLIILLGATVLSVGRVVAEHHSDLLTLLLAVGAFIALVCLWLVYFGRSEQLVLSHTSSTENPIRSIHIGINIIYGVVISLVVFAAGINSTLAHAHDPRSGAAGVLVLIGPMIYLLSQAIYFRLEPRASWTPRLIGAAALGAAAIPAFWIPAYGVVALLVVPLLALAIHLSRST